ncbi:MAG TPA: hypothetical protein VGB17_08115 [Pyrinomonadaceae bacterium]|jgi:hypothetical protein
MLFIESKISDRTINHAARLALLEKLQDKGLIPLIRSSRLNSYEQVLLGQERVQELERAIADWMEQEDDAPYVQGDLFCSEDFVLFLVFGGKQTEGGQIRAGIIYEAGTTEPLKKLDAFCRNITDAFEAVRSSIKEGFDTRSPIEWSLREASAQTLPSQFNTIEAGSLFAPQEARPEQSLALEVLEDTRARRFLHRVSEAHPDGRVADLLGESDAGADALINRLANAGLLRREILVSCRKLGRPLFSLPSTEALSVINASNAVCSDCGASIADEKVEDLVKPTEIAATLLADGSWLTSRVYAVLRGLGIDATDIAAGPASSEGEAHLLLKVCGDAFLFVLRDGDLTVPHTRRAFDKVIETEAAHLLMIATGDVQEDARVRLREHARRRARSGSEIEVILIEGLNTLADELQDAFERASQRAVVQELCELDASLGFSAGYMIATRFRLQRSRPGAPREMETAVGTLAESLSEI